jgi:hypothetical protein
MRSRLTLPALAWMSLALAASCTLFLPLDDLNATQVRDAGVDAADTSRLDGASSDGGVEASAAFCTNHPAALLCLDFDREGIPAPARLSTGARMGLDPSGKSPPNAVFLEMPPGVHEGRYFEGARASAGSFRFSFDFQAEGFSTRSFTIAEVGFSQGRFIDVVYAPQSGFRIVEQSSDVMEMLVPNDSGGGTFNNTGWMRVVLEVSVSRGLLSLSVDDRRLYEGPLNPGIRSDGGLSISVGTPYVKIDNDVRISRIRWDNYLIEPM